MLKSKKSKEVQVIVEDSSKSDIETIVPAETHTTLDKGVDIVEAVEINALEDSLAAIMDILKNYMLCDDDYNIRIVKREEEGHYIGDLKPYFQTMEVESGQINRLINSKSNGEGVLPLPAVFLHFIDMHWDVGTFSIGSCKAILRMKVVLNRLDMDSYDGQMNAYRVAHAIMNCVNEHKGKYSAFTRKFQLDYLDMMESWTKGIQYFWLTYQIWLNDYTTYSYKRYVERHVVVPPYTDHRDQDPENNDFGHPDHDDMSYDESSKFITPDGTERIPIRNR